MRISTWKQETGIGTDYICMFCGLPTETGGLWHSDEWHAVCPHCAGKLGMLFADTVADATWANNDLTKALTEFEKNFWYAMYLNEMKRNRV